MWCHCVGGCHYDPALSTSILASDIGEADVVYVHFTFCLLLCLL